MAKESEKNVLLKITQKDIYNFFNSEDLGEFTLGSKNCNVTIKAAKIEPCHIKFLREGNNWFILDTSEAKSVKLNRKPVGTKTLRVKEGDVVYIASNSKKEKPVLSAEIMKKINTRASGKISSIPVCNKNEYLIGRDESCDIIVESPLVEKKHAKIIFDGADCYIMDLRTINGTFVNNKKIKRVKLSDYDRISLAGAAYIYFDKKLLSSKSDAGIEIEAIDVEKEVYDRKNHRKLQLLDKVNLTVKAGEFVGVVGGSGAGKSTFLDCVNGLRPCTAGKILYDGNDYYENINSFRGVVGIVPQKDVMHDDLCLEESLFYTAKIRMRSEMPKDEVIKRVRRAIKDVRLDGKEYVKVSSLSGGQRKRASIAMELLADPKVIFLDEPTSGLSPDLDLEIMELLKELAAKGRTIIMITHAMDNIDKCDRVAFLGRGGKMCFYGTAQEIFPYFKAERYSDIFNQLNNEKRVDSYAAKYRKSIGREAMENE